MQADPKNKAERKAAFEGDMAHKMQHLQLDFCSCVWQQIFHFSSSFVRYSELNEKSPETCGGKQGTSKTEKESVGWEGSCRAKRGYFYREAKKKTCIGFGLLFQMNLQASSPVGPANWFQPLQVMIAVHSSVQEAAGMAGETWDLTAGRGKGGKSRKWPPTFERCDVSCLSPLPPERFLSSLPHTH